MFRRSNFFVVTAIAMFWSGYQLAWHPEALQGASVLSSIGAVVAITAAIGFLVWQTIDPRRWTAIAACLLGVLSAGLAAPLWGAIGWVSLLWLTLAVLIVSTLYVGTIVLDVQTRFDALVARFRR